ncbi:MAG: peptidoglycan-binding domain-containing protein [Thalassospira sp.]|uniref:peptidoglycan-binding domain-containing protein n=1 Tax=Thalassospira sp. TaxID=1912094 RepID=UPI003A8B843F
MKSSFLRGVLASNAAAHPDDVIVVRRTLNGAGVTVGKDESYPTSELFNGIRAFQKGHGLVVDGQINPGGETENSLKDYIELTNLTRCRNCGVLHGGVYSPFYCSDCLGKMLQ